MSCVVCCGVAARKCPPMRFLNTVRDRGHEVLLKDYRVNSPFASDPRGVGGRNWRFPPLFTVTWRGEYHGGDTPGVRRGAGSRPTSLLPRNRCVELPEAG